MSANTKNKTQTDRSLLQLGFISLFIIALTLFCKAMNFSLIIPFLLFYIGFHIKMVRTISVQRFIHLGFLLTLIVFTAIIVDQYTAIPHYYIPVSVIGMFTVLLYSDLQLTFFMSFISSLLICLMIGGDFGMMILFFLGSMTGAYVV
ncbi:MAG: hypothetical protein KC713_04110, partial [Candidatus Omnitrophica bacterium]|nr:hypothetical protein [Candidatus Omnitrophota bacterium]